MSLLTKTEASVNSFPDRVNSLRTSLHSLLNSITTTPPLTYHTSYHTLLTTSTSLRSDLLDVDKTVHKLLVKAREPDPDAQVYGAASEEEDRGDGTEVGRVKPDVTAVLEEVEKGWKEAEERKVEEERRLAREAEELKKKMEEDRAREAAEKQRQEEEKLRQQKAEEERRAEEQRLRVEREAKAKEEAEEKAKADASRRQKEAEQKAKDEAERKMKEEADKLRAEEEEKKRRADEEARKPPIQRAREGLVSALEVLGGSCQVSSDHLIALQMLVKFVSQIVNNPHESRYRVVNVANPIIKQRLMGKKGGAEALKAIGFSAVGGQEGKEGEEWTIQASAEAWTVIVQAKGILETELKEVQGGKKYQPTPAAPSAPRPTPPASTPSPASAATPPPVRAPQPAPTNPFAALFPPTPSTTTSTATGQAGALPPFNPFATLFSQPASTPSPSSAPTPPSPLAALNDPLFRSLMSNPRLMSTLMAGNPMMGGQGTQGDMMRVMMEEFGRDPSLLTSMMSSPMMQSMMSRPEAMQQMMGMMGGGGLGATAPAAGAAANPFASLMQQMMAGGMGGLSPASAAPAAPSPAAAPSNSTTSAPSSSTAPANASSGSTTAPMDEELTEEQLLEQALAMSMQSDQPPPNDKKDQSKQ